MPSFPATSAIVRLVKLSAGNIASRNTYQQISVRHLEETIHVRMKGIDIVSFGQSAKHNDFIVATQAKVARVNRTVSCNIRVQFSTTAVAHNTTNMILTILVEPSK